MNQDNKKVIKVCHGHSCGNLGQHIFSRLEADLTQNPEKKCILKKGQCRGLCAEWPNVAIEQNGKTEIHKRMDPIKASKIL